ncbi:MAG: methylenetetrahydrofolate reductase [Oligoflexia bacterium]|nr:methylenetetrahydrofolate reductase [Oligoflexia bacterium]
MVLSALGAKFAMGLKELINCSGKTIVCLEVNPPRGSNLEPVVARLEGQLGGIDLINVTDSALAKMRMAALPFAAILKQRFQVEPLVNLSCRDRNVLALQADLLASWSVGIKSVVALTGDAMTVGDSPERKGVFEVNSVGLLGLIEKLNSGFDLEGHELDGCTGFICGCVVNPNARNIQAELKRLGRKKEAGARYALSQPVFDADAAEQFFKAAQPIGIPILSGLMPWKSAKLGLGLSKVPGIRLPEALVREFEGAGAADLSDASIEYCLSLSRRLAPYVRGFHVISGATPKLALRLAQGLVKEFAG